MRAAPVSVVMAAFSLAASSPGAEPSPPDLSKLPPPAAQAVDFTRDIQPIFEQSCYRCHGSGKIKSGFRLDTRTNALRGGDGGTDIVPGNSGASRLIHFVSGAVADMEMPPTGKAPPLSPSQIGLLRAWIDQGAAFGEPVHYPQTAFTISPGLRFTLVHGDRQKFRELNGFKEGWQAGISSFELSEKISNETSFEARGHILPHDYDLRAGIETRDFGFARFGFQQFRTYSNDRGPVYDFYSPNQFRLGRDLHLDDGRVWMEAGLAIPRLPQVTLGYEFAFREGTRSTLEWGQVLGKNYFPAAKEIDEHTHLLRLDLSYDFHDWHVEDAVRIEFHDLTTYRANVASYSFGPRPDLLVNTRENAGHTLGLNALHAEKQLTDWWFVSSGYYYSKMEADAGLNQITTDGEGKLTGGTFWYSDEILLRREIHIASFSTLVRPLDSLHLSFGLQAEWEGQLGAGHIHLDEGDPSQPLLFILEPAFLESNVNRKRLAESAGLRFTGLSHAVLFADARLAQEKVDQFEREIGGFGHDFLRDTDYENARSELRAGATISPWRAISLETSVKEKFSKSDYDHLPLYSPNGPQGYPAFILNREIRDQSVQARLALASSTWCKTHVSFEAGTAGFRTRTEPVFNTPRPGQSLSGGTVVAGSYEEQRYGLTTLLTPHPRLSFNGALTFATYRLRTENNEHPSLVPYRNEVWTLSASAAYVVDARTELACGYDFSKSAFDSRHFIDAIPLELAYQRHEAFASIGRTLTSNTTVSLRYNLDVYSESLPQNGFTAHGVFALLTYRWK